MKEILMHINEVINLMEDKLDSDEIISYSESLLFETKILEVKNLIFNFKLKNHWKIKNKEVKNGS